MALSHIEFEGAEILFRNFEGREGMFNQPGNRNFCLLLDDETAEQMTKDGWNVKRLKPRDDEPVGAAYVQVAVYFRKFPPKIVLITSRGRTTLTEDEVDILDWIDIKHIDLVINPREWSTNGASGVKAYLKAMYITQDEDSFERKYASIPEIGHGPAAIESPTEADYVDGEVVDENVLEIGR